MSWVRGKRGSDKYLPMPVSGRNSPRSGGGGGQRRKKAAAERAVEPLYVSRF